MSTRTALGAADVDDATLAAWLGADTIVAARVAEIEYALPAMTTGGRWWVTGTAAREGKAFGFRVVVKVAQSPRRSAVWDHIPPRFQAQAELDLPWQVEPAVYRAWPDLPDPLRLPRVLAVRTLDDHSAALWLEAVDHDTAPWTPDRYAEAARSLGRLAVSPSLRDLADRVGQPMAPEQARRYWTGRLQAQFVPAYRSDDLWLHPVVARHVDDALRSRLMSLLHLVPSLIEEIEALPLLVAHGDACPNNLLVEPGGFCLIDWSFFGRGRLAFDLSQLVISEIELGRQPATDLPRLQRLVVDAFTQGLSDGGLEVDPAAVARAHAIQLAVGSGVAAVPLDHLDADPAVLDPLVGTRMAALDHVLTGVGL